MFHLTNFPLESFPYFVVPSFSLKMNFEKICAPSKVEGYFPRRQNDSIHFQVALGKRIGMYRLGKELGSGNFSKVKLGVHVLAKGLFLLFGQ